MFLDPSSAAGKESDIGGSNLQLGSNLERQIVGVVAIGAQRIHNGRR